MRAVAPYWITIGLLAFALGSCKKNVRPESVEGFVVREPSEILGKEYVGAPPEVSPGPPFFDGNRPLVWVTPQSGESMDEAQGRADAWLGRAPLGAGERWAFEDFHGDDATRGSTPPEPWKVRRGFVVGASPAFNATDIDSVSAARDNVLGTTVSFTLRRDPAVAAGKRIALRAEGAWVVGKIISPGSLLLVSVPTPEAAKLVVHAAGR